MKNENNFPNIKPVELKEEQNDSNKNKEENKMDKENINNNNKKCINEKIKNISFCFFYFIFFSFLMAFFVLNYFYTKNAFDDNKNILIPAEKLCTEKINALAKCFKEKTNKKCSNEEKYLETCYDQVHSLNQKCYVFISELELCYRKNNNDKDKNNKCENIEKDLILCGTGYKYFTIKNINLKDLFSLN